MTMHVGSQSTYLEEEFGMPTPHGSAELRGVASETKNLPLIAITSISEAPQTIHATCIGESPADPGRAIELPAYGTAVVRACAWDTLKDDTLGLATALQHAPGSPSQNHAISLKTDSVPGAFYAFGFALNGSIAQAQLQPLDFYDPGLLPSTKTVYVGVPFGPESRLLNANFSPTLTLANFSAQPRSTTVTVVDSSSGTPKPHQLTQVTVPALSTKTVRIPSESGTGLLNTFTIASDGQPGDVQVHLFTNRDSAEDRLELLAKDARDDHNGGDHPWSIENGNSSTLLLYNPTSTPQEFQVRISGNNASWVKLYTLQPSETKDISINDIITQQLPDIKKDKLPKDLINGEVQWSTQFGASGLGRLLVTSRQASLKRSFSCPTYSNMCGSSFGPNTFADVVYDTSAFFSAINVTQCTEYCPSCCGQTSPTGSSYSFSTQWQNNNPSIVRTVSSSNTQLQLQGISAGSFGFTALITEGSCQSGPGGGGGNVRLSITKDHNLWFFGLGNQPPQNFTLGSAAATLTANGASNGQYTWTLTSGSSIAAFENGSSTITKTNANTVGINAIGYSSAVGDVTISLTYAPSEESQQTAAFSLSVDSPYQLVSPGATTNRGVTNSCTNPSAGVSGYQSLVPYRIISFFGTQISNIGLNEIFSNNTDDYIGNNWPLYVAGSFVTPDGTFADNLCAIYQTIPVSLPPASPLGGTKIDHGSQAWAIGSTKIGSGVIVQTDVLQRYQDHGTHTAIHSPIR